MNASVLLSVAALGLAAPAMAQPTSPAPATAPVVTPNAVQWDTTSRVTGRTYRIFVSAPPEGTPVPAKGFPVVYLTDGDLTFHIAADAARMMSRVNEARPAIIVAVGYGRGMDAAVRDRFTDLTPMPPAPAMKATLDASPMGQGVQYGDAENFYRFLTEELRPQIEAAYRTDRTDNSLWGHSLGGLFGLHVLFNHPEAFRSYMLGTPSIVWGDHAILKDEPKLTAPLAAGKAAPRVLLMAGGLEENAPEGTKLPAGVTLEQYRALQKASGAISNPLALAARLKALKCPGGCEIETMVFEGETHVSVMPALISRGLRFALTP